MVKAIPPDSETSRESWRWPFVLSLFVMGAVVVFVASYGLPDFAVQVSWKLRLLAAVGGGLLFSLPFLPALVIDAAKLVATILKGKRGP